MHKWKIKIWMHFSDTCIFFFLITEQRNLISLFSLQNKPLNTRLSYLKMTQFFILGWNKDILGIFLACPWVCTLKSTYTWFANLISVQHLHIQNLGSVSQCTTADDPYIKVLNRIWWTCHKSTIAEKIGRILWLHSRQNCELGWSFYFFPRSGYLFSFGYLWTVIF